MLQNLNADWLVEHLGDADFFCFHLHGVVAKSSDCHDRTFSLCFETHNGLLFLHAVEPVLLSVFNLRAHLEAVNARHLNVSQHKLKTSRTTLALQLLLETLHCKRPRLESYASNA